MPRVFVPNQPKTYDRSSGSMVPKVDLEPAGEFGPLTYLLDDAELQGAPEEILAKLKVRLSGFGPSDYLLLAGDPLVQAWAAAIAADLVEGELKMLHWVRRAKRYRVIAVPLWPEAA